MVSASGRRLRLVRGRLHFGDSSTAPKPRIRRALEPGRPPVGKMPAKAGFCFTWARRLPTKASLPTTCCRLSMATICPAGIPIPGVS